MSDIVIRNNAAVAAPDQSVPGTDLVAWARQAEAAAVYAEMVCKTTMVPAQYRNKPAEAAAAILAGKELGFSPMASLRAFDNIQGVPAPKAITLRAVVQAAGHEVVVVESSATKAVVKGRRAGSDEWQPSTWDIPRARLMPQFKSNANYVSNPAAMLVARATAEVCRWVGADAIMGMPYAAEEVADMPELIQHAPLARRLDPAELDESGATIDAEQGDLPPEMMTDDQRRRMFALWNELGYTGDENRAARIEMTGRIVRRPGLTSSSELTAVEAAGVIDVLQRRLEAQRAAVAEAETTEAEVQE
jgi:hypothetical protein